MESLFEIKAQQLLVAAEDPQFGDGRKIGSVFTKSLFTPTEVSLSLSAAAASSWPVAPATVRPQLGQHT